LPAILRRHRHKSLFFQRHAIESIAISQGTLLVCLSCVGGEMVEAPMNKGLLYVTFDRSSSVK
jgi:hypothetical protein